MFVGVRELRDDLTKRLCERALEGEFAAHLGYEKHTPEDRNRGNSCNGKNSRRRKTDTGGLDFETPWDRVGSFDPVLVPKGDWRPPGFDEKVVALCPRGI